MMRTFWRVVVGVVVVGGTAPFDARTIDAETVEQVEVVTTGDVEVWVPDIPTSARFELTTGDQTFSREDLDAATRGILKLSFRNHTVGSPPKVERILCPGAGSSKKAGLKLRVTGLSAGTEIVATFSAESGTGVPIDDRKLGPVVLSEQRDVKTGICEKL